MKAVNRRKNNYGLLIALIIAISLVFGFLFDHLCTQIEYRLYPRPSEYQEYIKKYANEYGLPEELVYAVIKTESDFDLSAVSSRGAIGLMQIMPATFEWITNDLLREYLAPGMVYDPETNIKYGTYYLSRLYKKFSDMDTAIAAYNGGEGNVSEWLKDSRYSDNGIKLKIDKIPDEFAETENYVKKVNKALQKYQELY